MGKPDPPTPPNPLATAAAQTGTNVSSAVANAYLNNVNQNTPEGSLNYAVSGNYGWTDPTTGQTYQIPTFTSTQSLTPQGQQLLNTTNQTKQNLAQMGADQSARVSGLLSSPFNPNVGAPAAGNAQGILNVPKAATSYDAGGPIQTSIGGYGQQQTSFDDTGVANQNAIQRSYGSGLDVNAVQQALWGQMQPGLDVQQNKLQQQLADQGIRYGSAAYNNAMQPFGQQYNQRPDGDHHRRHPAAGDRDGDPEPARPVSATPRSRRPTARRRVAARSPTPRSRTPTSRRSAPARSPTRRRASRTPRTPARPRSTTPAWRSSSAQQQSGFNAQNAALNQYLQQAYQQRNQPLNEISALMCGSQLQHPNWLNSPTSQIPTTDIAGITNQNFQNQMGIYNAQNQKYQSLMGGILGLGAGALKVSDRRLKDDITPMGTVLAAGDNGERKELPIYQYSYKQDPASLRHIGPMAQDVEQIRLSAVEEHGGRKFIRPREVMGSIMRAA